MQEPVKQQPELKKKILTAKQRKLSNFFLGAQGEDAACNYLCARGYTIQDQNIRVGNTEIDIVALDTKADELVFVEVKTRSSQQFGNPELAVTNKKIRHMQFVATHYMKSNHCTLDYRFDIISVTYLGKQETNPQPQIEHFENITWP